MTTLISEAEVIQFLKWIEDGTITLKADIDPQQTYAGDVTYTASNGWRITVFNDANEWDYVDSVVASDGRTLNFDEINGQEINQPNQ